MDRFSNRIFIIVLLELFSFYKCSILPVCFVSSAYLSLCLILRISSIKKFLIWSNSPFMLVMLSSSISNPPFFLLLWLWFCKSRLLLREGSVEINTLGCSVLGSLFWVLFSTWVYSVLRLSLESTGFLLLLAEPECSVVVRALIFSPLLLLVSSLMK